MLAAQVQVRSPLALVHRSSPPPRSWRAGSLSGARRLSVHHINKRGLAWPLRQPLLQALGTMNISKARSEVGNRDSQCHTRAQRPAVPPEFRGTLEEEQKLVVPHCRLATELAAQRSPERRSGDQTWRARLETPLETLLWPVFLQWAGLGGHAPSQHPAPHSHRERKAGGHHLSPGHGETRSGLTPPVSLLTRCPLLVHSACHQPAGSASEYQDSAANPEKVSSRLSCGRPAWLGHVVPRMWLRLPLVMPRTADFCRAGARGLGVVRRYGGIWETSDSSFPSSGQPRGRWTPVPCGLSAPLACGDTFLPVESPGRR